jgi:hypothetical protein
MATILASINGSVEKSISMSGCAGIPGEPFTARLRDKPHRRNNL